MVVEASPLGREHAQRQMAEEADALLQDQADALLQAQAQVELPLELDLEPVATHLDFHYHFF